MRVLVSPNEALECSYQPVIQLDTSSTHLTWRQSVCFEDEFGAFTQEGERGWLSPEGVTSRLLVENKMHLVPCASGLELPRRHAHKDFASNVVAIFSSEVRPRYMGRPHGSHPPLAFPLEDIRAPYCPLPSLENRFLYFQSLFPLPKAGFLAWLWFPGFCGSVESSLSPLAFSEPFNRFFVPFLGSDAC